MKKYLLRLGLLILICLGLIAGLTVFAFLGNPNRDAYMYAYRLKMERVDSVASPRLILVAGSSAAFGFDGRELGNQLGMNVVNTGLHTGIGLRFMIDNLRGRVNPGDVIVIIPEYELFTDEYYGSDEALTSAVVYSGPKALRLLNLKQWMIFLGGVPGHLRLNHSVPTEGYNSGNFNEVGDEVRHLTCPPGANNLRALPFGGNVEPAVLADFKSKIDELEAMGCRVVVLWSTCVESYYRGSLPGVERLNDAFAGYGIIPAAAPDYFVEPDSTAFDSVHHLNAAGVEENTRRMLFLLRNLE